MSNHVLRDSWKGTIGMATREKEVGCEHTIDNVTEQGDSERSSEDSSQLHLAENESAMRMSQTMRLKMRMTPVLMRTPQLRVPLCILGLKFKKTGRTSQCILPTNYSIVAGVELL